MKHETRIFYGPNLYSFCHFLLLYFYAALSLCVVCCPGGCSFLFCISEAGVLKILFSKVFSSPLVFTLWSCDLMTIEKVILYWSL